MSFPSTNNLYGFPQALTRVFPSPILSQRAPTTADYKYPIGQQWIDELGEDAYILVNVTSNTATWNVTATTPGNVDTLTASSGGALSPSAGNINIFGTANQITTAGSGSTITLTLPAAMTAPGSLTTTTTLASGTTLTAGTSLSVTTSATVGTSITSTLGNITATNGNVVLGTAGNKIISTSVASTTAAGANSFGKVTLEAGTATVSTTAVTANSIIVLTRMGVGSTGAAALGLLSVGTISAGTSFIINAWSGTDATVLATTDVSSIGWMIIN